VIPVKVFLDCIPCTLRQAVEASRMATSNRRLQEKALKLVMLKLGRTSLTNKTPMDISAIAHRTIRRVTGNNDPYKKLKYRYNREAMRLYPKLKRRVAESRDQLLTATKLAIAGNVIDFGPGHSFDLRATIEETLHQDLSVNHYHRFRRELKKSNKIAFLADNAGEIVFDRILLEELRGKTITFVVKGGPILNDATVEDAKFAGIDKIAGITTVSNGERGTGPERNSAKFIKFLRSMDVVISKGQGNYEALSGVKANIFYLLKVKCPVVAKDTGTDVGDILLLSPRK